MYSALQVFFLLSFFCLLFLLLIFGETTVGIPLLGLLLLLCLACAKHLNFKQLSKYPWPVASLAVFVTVAAFSTFTTVSLPLTVSSFVYYAAAFVVFVFFLCVDSKWLPSTIIIWGSSILAVIFSALTLLYTAAPFLSKALPTVTLLTASYGHNQASVLFLLMLPVMWYIAERQQNRLARVGIAFLLAGIVVSFARVALVIGALEFLLLTLTSTDLKLRRLGKILLGLLAVLIIGLVVLNGWGKSTAPSCELPIFQEQLCKPIHKELRPAYWSQAVRAWIKRPLFGWGGGTFALLSPLFQTKNGEYSGYAHNEVLQALAEYGLFGGGAFAVFVFWVGIQAIRLLQTKVRRETFCLSLSVLGVILTSFFDFGWHMIGLWIFFLLFVAIWLKETASEGEQPSPKLTLFSKAAKLLTVLCFLSVVIWSTSYVVSTVLWTAGKNNAAIKTFPFAYWKVETTVRSPHTVEPETLAMLLSLYTNHYRVWDSAASSEQLDAVQKTEYLRHAISLDPLSQFRYYPYLQAALLSGDTKDVLQAAQTWQEKKLAGRLDSYSYEIHGEVAGLLIDEANNLLAENDHAAALKLYRYAMEIQEEELPKHKLLVLEQIGSLPIQETLPFLNDLKYETVWEYGQSLYEGERTQLENALSQGNAEVAEQLMKNIVHLGGEFDWQVMADVTRSWKLRKSLNVEQLQAYARIVLRWEKESTKGSEFDFQVKQPLMEELRNSAAEVETTDPKLSQTLAELASQIDSNVVDTR